ncbi:unnamed protein product [Clavelina lepadiformis]|uniref:Uncharacterized protein n=1 Tax=Clavelina lepadiformis TaxID=159417 RepID=A0ABP0F2A4_CLALP
MSQIKTLICLDLTANVRTSRKLRHQCVTYHKWNAEQQDIDLLDFAASSPTPTPTDFRCPEWPGYGLIACEPALGISAQFRRNGE